MKLFTKLLAAYLLVFVIYFTIVGGLGAMINGKNFFWLTPEKLIVRILIPAFVVAQLYAGTYQWKWLKK